jgi:hypothetical protein
LFTTSAVAASAPTVSTSAISNKTQTTATSGGTIVSNGGATVTVSGVAWSTSVNPTTASSHTTDGWATGGPWADSITGLTASTTYHVRAYATNSVGTSYGSDVSFTTNAVAAGSAPVITISATVVWTGPLGVTPFTDVTWSVTNNPTSCVASGNWAGDKALGGGTERMNGNADATYILTCTNAYGSDTESATIGSEIHGPDLTAGNPTSSGIIINVPIQFTSTIRNNGDVSTGSSFWNFFRVASQANGGGTITDLAPSFMSALSARNSNTAISPNYTFTALQTYSVMACADKSSMPDPGTITESAENNNCSGWMNITTQDDSYYCGINLSYNLHNANSLVDISWTVAAPGNGPTTWYSPRLRDNTDSTYNTTSAKNYIGDVARYPGSQRCSAGSLYYCTDLIYNNFICVGNNCSLTNIPVVPGHSYHGWMDVNSGSMAPYTYGICATANGDFVAVTRPTISASPATIVSGDSSTLTWSGTGSCTGNFDTHSNASSGSTVVSPTSNTTYTVTCSGASNQTTVTVKKKPIIIEN